MAVALLGLLVGSAGVAAAQESANSEDNSKWEFVVAPYLLFPHMDGQTTVRGFPVEVDVGPSEIFEKLDFGAMLANAMIIPFFLAQFG